MKIREAELLLRRELGRLLKALGLSHFSIDLVVGRCSDNSNQAESSVMDEYQRGQVTVDPAKHDDAEELTESLRHELQHFLIAPFDHVQEQVMAYLEDDKAAARAIGEAFRVAKERTVRNLERTDMGLEND